MKLVDLGVCSSYNEKSFWKALTRSFELGYDIYEEVRNVDGKFIAIITRWEIE